MLYCGFELSNEIRLWWDERNEMRQGYKYKVTVNDKNCVYTKKNYYNFKNVEEGAEYKLVLEVVDEQNNVVGEKEELVGRTLPKKECINVTKPPYNAVGDGVTDCTDAIRQAFADCSSDKYVYFPFGVYVCENVTFSNEMKILFDAGATLCSKEEAKKL